MKTWSLMYALVWVALVQILVVLFPVLEAFQTYDAHAVLGAVVLAMSYAIFVRVRDTPCPARVKRITKTTLGLGAFQAILGAALYGALYASAGGGVIGAIAFLHVVTAVAIITQAASSATAYDMWEEKEFVDVPVATVQG